MRLAKGFWCVLFYLGLVSINGFCESIQNKKQPEHLKQIAVDKAPYPYKTLRSEFKRAPSPMVLVIDLNKNKTDSSKIKKRIYFDYDKNGLRERFRHIWLEPGDGFLVRVKNDNELEFFGAYSIPKGANKKIPELSGLAALKTLDDNGDLIINAKDKVFKELRVWIDVNQNARVDDGELQFLHEAGVVAIIPDKIALNQPQYIDNRNLQNSFVLLDDDTQADIYELGLYQKFNSRREDKAIIVPEDIAKLPNARGSGLMHDLHQAMVLNPALKGYVIAVIEEKDPSWRSILLDQLIYHWTGTENIDPNSRDHHQYGHVIDARKLAALEVEVGVGFLGLEEDDSRNPNPHAFASPILIEQYNKFKYYVDAQLTLQIDLKDDLKDIVFTRFSSFKSWRIRVEFFRLEEQLYTLYIKEGDKKLLELLTCIDNLNIYFGDYKKRKAWAMERSEFLRAVMTKLETTPNTLYISRRYWPEIVLHGEGRNEHGRVDIIRFDKSIAVDDIKLSRQDSTLIITYKPNGQTLKITGYLCGQETNPHSVRKIQFVGDRNVEMWTTKDVISLLENK